MGKSLNESIYVEEAEQIIQILKQENKRLISASKLRNILSMLADLYNRVFYSRGENLLDRNIEIDLKYCKMRCAYEAGRDPEVRKFVDKTHIMEYIDGIGNSKERFILYYRYVEALVAYHKYYGGE